MNIIIAGKNIELDQYTKDFITEKVNNKLVAFLTRLHNINIVITKEKNDLICECDITSDFGEFFASGFGATKETAIDHSLDRIISELRKKHDKLVDHHKRNHKEV